MRSERVPTYSEPPSNARKPTDSETLLGQVMTPCWLADYMIEQLSELTREVEDLEILDPCIGEAAFQLAAEKQFTAKFHCFDIDPKMINISEQLLSSCHNISAELLAANYLTSDLSSQNYNAAISNPPYVRHEWIKNRREYTELFSRKYGLKLPGTSNLYVYFIVKMIEELSAGGKFCFLVYDSWMNTKYGQWLVNYLNKKSHDIQSEHVSILPLMDI